MKHLLIKKICNKVLSDTSLVELKNRPNDCNEIEVSILCLCYNHEQYLKRCLDGFLSQKVNFNVEIIIHDDLSSDNSVSIIKEYQKKYPTIIKPIFEKENQYSKGVNIENTIMSKIAKGKYIAICEGDDYWSDPYKLALQVEMFRNFSNCTYVVHKTKCVDLKGRIIRLIPENKYKSTLFKREYIVPKIIVKYQFHTTSYMFKKVDYDSYCNNLPEFAKRMKVGDYALQLYFSNLGDTVYIDRTMSVHVDGTSGSWTNANRNADVEQRQTHRKIMRDCFQLFDEYTNFEFHSVFLKNYNKSKMHELYENGDYQTILENKGYSKELKKYDRKSYRTIYLKINHPKLYKFLKALKNE